MNEYKKFVVIIKNFLSRLPIMFTGWLMGLYTIIVTFFYAVSFVTLILIFLSFPRIAEDSPLRDICELTPQDNFSTNISALRDYLFDDMFIFTFISAIILLIALFGAAIIVRNHFVTSKIRRKTKHV